MALSNTATPKYYGEFKAKVLKGEIPICHEIEMEMNRIDELIRDPGIYYDPDAVECWIKFCEGELTLTDGSEMHLLDTFKLWGEQVFGWFYFMEQSVYEPGEHGKPGRYVNKMVKKRLTKEQYLIVARGAAKSMYDSDIQGYFLCIDRKTTYQVTTAPTMLQAEEVMSPLKTALARSRGPYFKFMTAGSMQNTTGSKANRPKLAATKDGIVNFMTNSLLQIRPMSIDKLQGIRSKICTVDEWLSGDIKENVVGSLVQSCAKGMQDYLIIASSSEGCVRNGPGDDVKMMLMKILKGEIKARHVSIWWYRLDDIKEVADPSMWLKANPNLGKTVGYDVYQQDVERAEANPSERNDILAKRFGLPMEGYTYFFRYEETKPHPRRDFWNMRCSLGCDLSRGDDFCAFTFLFPLPREEFGVKCRSYITQNTLDKLPMSQRVKYEQFIQEGTLIIFPGTVLDMMQVYDNLNAYIERCKFEVCSLGYDPYNAREFVERWEKENSPYGIEKVIQGAKTESVPLGEIKLLAENRLLIFDQEIMQYTMGNSMTVTDTNGNRKLLKQRYDQKIDNVSALMDAWVAYKLHKEDFE